MIKIIIFIFTFSILFSCSEKSEDSKLFSTATKVQVDDQNNETAQEDIVLPEISITDAQDINNSNKSAYSLSGTCSESGLGIDVSIGEFSQSTSCILGSFILNNLDISSLSDGSIDISAQHINAEGNTNSDTLTVTKDTQNAVVAINSIDPVNSINQTDFVITGSCSESDTLVDVFIDTINLQPSCSAGSWSTGYVDLSSLSDGSLMITADHSNAIQASTSVEKDTVSAVVTISTPVDITSSNQTNYLISGDCTENSTVVDIFIGTINIQPNCTSGTWSSDFIDVSALDDGSIIITADHASASQVSSSINKATATPTVSSLSVPSSLTNTIDLNWSLDDPGGFSIEDYVINYRKLGTSTWLLFEDDIATETEGNVSGLTASTSYEFKVKVIYDSTSESAWSSVVEGTTQPDSEVFGANKAMNVGGATASTVVAYQDNTIVTLNGNPLVTLNKGESHQFNSSQFDIIDADKPIYTAGKIGTGTGSSNQGNIVWQPTAWAGKSFSFNATRTNPQEVYLYAIEDTYVEVKQGSTVLDSITLTADQSGTLNWSTYGSYQIVATGSVLAFHMSRASNLYYDPKPLMPGHTEIIGFPSSSMRLTSVVDGTSYNLFHSNSVSGSGSLNKADVVQINPQGISSLFRGESLLILSSKKISGASFADSNGYCAAPFMPTNLMKKKYILPVNSDYIAFASKEAGTIDVLDSSDNIVTTLTLTQSGSNPNAPYKVRMASPSAGYRFVASVNVAAWYQSSTTSFQASQDETILYGTND